MLIRKLIFIYMILLNSHNAFAEDIPTQNLGEKAMISSLREEINKNEILNASKFKIILGAGINGCQAFKSKPQQNEINVLLTWQWLDNLTDIDNSTFLVVPEHAIDHRFEDLQKRGVKLILISGVIHNKTQENIMKEEIVDIDPSTQYIAMLAGDTQQEDGKWTKFDRNMLLGFLKFLPEDKKILILNGPRTGKFKENLEEMDMEAHKTSVDYITKAVMKKNIPNWKVMDFKYGEKSYWEKALKFCLLHTDVALILPGESTSMISEALGLGILPVIYNHEAMTKNSLNYINILAGEQKILIYPKMGKKIYNQNPVADQKAKIIKELVEITKNLNLLPK